MDHLERNVTGHRSQVCYWWNHFPDSGEPCAVCQHSFVQVHFDQLFHENEGSFISLEPTAFSLKSSLLAHGGKAICCFSSIGFFQTRYMPSGKQIVMVIVKVAQSCPTLCNPMDYTYSHWNSPGQNTGVGSLSLLQGIFPTQGSSPGLLHCRQILHQLSHQGSPRKAEMDQNCKNIYVQIELYVNLSERRERETKENSQDGLSERRFSI